VANDRYRRDQPGKREVNLTLLKPSKQHLTLIVLSGVPGTNGLVLGPDETFGVQ
jgi:hypothetical protein